MRTETQIFEDDLVTGQAGERAIANFLQDKLGWDWIYFNESSDKQVLKEFDFYMYDGHHKSVEVKTDRYETYHGKTDNMVIEYSCNDKPSGINATKADVFVYYYPDHETAYIIDTDKLRALIKTPGFVYHSASAGQGLRARVHLVNRIGNGRHFMVVHVPREYYEREIEKK